jgi:hypothetical protein
LQELALEYNAPVSERELCDRVLQRRPSQAKDPCASIREKLRWDGAQVGWVRLGGGEVMPLRLAREGLCFRVIPSDEEYRSDQITRYRLLPFINPYDVNIQLEDADGRPIKTPAPSAAQRDPTFIPAAAAQPVGDWFRRSGFQQGDSILVTIV